MTNRNGDNGPPDPPHEDDAARTERLSRQLVDLQQPSERLSRFVDVVCRRREPQRESWRALHETEGLGDVEWRNEPFTLPALELLRTDRTGEPVAVVAGEALVPVPEDARRGIERRLKEKGFRVVEEDCGGVVRVRAQEDDPVDTRALLRRLASAGVGGQPHNVSALRGDMKSADGPEHTDAPPDPESVDPGRGEGACVVVIDTGLDPFAIVGKRGDDWLANMDGSDVDPLDVFDGDTGVTDPDGYLDGGAGHGTFVAGVIRQIAPAAEVTVLRALDTRGLGGECEIARAIARAGKIFDRSPSGGVLNLSLGIQTPDGLPPAAVELALQRLPSNVLVVAAAGNVPLDEPIWPAWSKRAIGVGALRRDPERGLVPTSWTNVGHHVDFSALGDGVSSTYVTGAEHPSRGEPDTFPWSDAGQTDAYALWSGTSFSAPKISAMLAIELVDAQGEQDPADAAVRALRGNRPYLPGSGHLVDV